VVGVTADDTYVSVMIEEKQAFIGTNRLLMMFDSKDFKLKQWTVTDVQGFDTTIAVSNLDTSKRPGPQLVQVRLYALRTVARAAAGLIPRAALRDALRTRSMFDWPPRLASSAEAEFR